MNKKNIMGGQKIPLLNKIESYISILKLHLKGDWNTENSAKQYLKKYYELKEIYETYSLQSIMNIKALEIGCGQRAVLTLIFHTFGVDITGFDVEVPTFRMNPKIVHDSLRFNGVERTVKSAVRYILFDKSFFRNLEKLMNQKIKIKNVKIELQDISNLIYEQNKFDFIFSFWAFEHISNIEGTIKNINKILKDEGILCIGVHLFPSLSGGHCPDWMKGEESYSKTKIPPWDHLRGSAYKVNCYLNKLKKEDFLDIFKNYYDILDIKFEIEGESLLTTEILREVPSYYTRNDLITRSMVITCKKRIRKFN